MVVVVVVVVVVVMVEKMTMMIMTKRCNEKLKNKPMNHDSAGKRIRSGVRRRETLSAATCTAKGSGIDGLIELLDLFHRKSVLLCCCRGCYL